MEVQIFGIKKSADTRKALRFFSERRIKTHFVDLMERPASPGELRRFAQKFGVISLIDKDSRRFIELGPAVRATFRRPLAGEALRGATAAQHTAGKKCQPAYAWRRRSNVERLGGAVVSRPRLWRRARSSDIEFPPFPLKLHGSGTVTYRVLVTDEIDAEGVALLSAEPRSRRRRSADSAERGTARRIANYDAIVGRSATRISADLLEKGRRLKVVGRAGVGVDNIAMDTATSLGVAVINAPAGNTIAVVELFFGAVISLLRHLARADTSMHAGRWDRSVLLGSELKGRTLGIVGLGRIGGEIATRARAFGMNVMAYDPYIAKSRFEALRVQEATSLESLIEQSNVLTLHTPLTDETTGMIGRRELMSFRQDRCGQHGSRGDP